jgi:gas vesicle structural protein
MSPRKPPRRRTEAEEILGTDDASLLDVVDNALNKGVVLSGDLTLALAQVDLVYVRLSLLLAAADRVLPGEQTDFMERHLARHELSLRRRAVTQRVLTRQSSRRRLRA